jgi:proteasome regulatory subunit
MKVDETVDLKRISKMAENFNGSVIKALVTEAGYVAIRNKKNKVSMEDFLSAFNRIKNKDKKYDLLNSSYD